MTVDRGSRPMGTVGADAPRSSRVAAVVARLGPRAPLARDALSAAGWGALSLAVVIPLTGPLAPAIGLRFSDPQRLAILVIVLAQAAALVIRRREPVLCLALVAVGQVLLTAVLPPNTTLRAAAPLVVAYTAGTLLKPAVLTVAIVGSVVLEAAGGWLVSAVLGAPIWIAVDARGGAAPDPSQQIAGAVLILLATVAAAAIGAWVAARRDQLRDERARADAALQRQGERMDAALAGERVRMARELHDIAAHHLSGLVVQASAAERLVDSDPTAAKEIIRGLRGQGREALENLRIAVGVLRDTRDRADGPRDDSAAPVPGLASLDELIRAARAAGDDLALHVLGDLPTLAPVADTAAYRVGQEAIANARRHAPGAPVRVVLDHRGPGTRLEVVNGPGPRPAAAGSAGFGLVGMRERADLLGAHLETGPTREGGWRVLFELPGPRGPEAIR